MFGSDLCCTRPSTTGVIASKDLRRRVRSYFTGSEKRARVKDMVGLAERVPELLELFDACVDATRRLAVRQTPAVVAA